MDYPDYYARLGVTHDASDKQIHAAYRRLVLRFHPDRNQGNKQAEEQLKLINEAFDVLSDAEQRQKYDQLHHSYQQWQRRASQSDAAGWDGWIAPRADGTIRFAPAGDSGHANSTNDLIADFMRARESGYAPGVQPHQGQDLELVVLITLEEAFFGTRRAIELDGRMIEVEIPGGARDGLRLRLSGRGGHGYAGGQSGDLYIIVEVEEHPHFRRDGLDLHLDLNLDLFTAVLGGTIAIPTLHGPVERHIPPGTQSGQCIRLREYGMPRLKEPTSRGDLYAHIWVRVPTALSAEEQALFERLRELARD